MTTAADQNVVPDQLLVSTPYARPVLERLSGPGFEIPVVQGRDTEDSVLLGLTRIFLAGKYDRAPASIRTGDGSIDVGLVLNQLRDDFKKDNEGWFPTMGKNRALADNFISTGSMIYGGVEDPQIPAEAISKLQEKWNNFANGRPSEPGNGVRVGIVDTQVIAAPPLQGALRGLNKEFLRRADYTIRAGHATFVAGLILSVAPGATVEVRGVLDKEGRADSWSAANAIVELGSSGVDILNLSFGCITGDGQPPLALATAIDLVDPRTVVVAAAGNFNPNGPKSFTIDGTHRIEDVTKCASFPAALDNVIAVGSSDGLEVAKYSPHGDWVDVYADGTCVTSTFLDALEYNGFARWTGTSFSAALVSGAIAAETKLGTVSARAAWDNVKKHTAAHQGGSATVQGRFVRPTQWFS